MAKLISCRYRLYPTREQQEKMLSWLGSLRWLYNTALAERRNNWRAHKKRISCHTQMSNLPALKHRNPEYAAIHSQVLQDVLRRLDRAYADFFRRLREGHKKPGYPRFKTNLNRYRSFTYPQSTGFRVLAGERKRRKIRLARIGNVRLIFHRELQGAPKTAMVVRYPSGKWYVIIVCEVADTPADDEAPLTGFDLGLTSYVTASDGEKIRPARCLAISMKKLRKEQRRLARTSKGSKRREKQRVRVARVNEHIADRRRDHQHQVSRKLVDSYGGFALEDLCVRGMLKNHKLAGAISDAGWRAFVGMVAYKAERAGKPFVLVPPRATSQICSGCDALVPKVLSERVHRCEACGVVLDRDHNAAINVKRRGERIRKLEKATVGTAGSSGGGMLPVNARGEETATGEGQLLRQVASGKREALSFGEG
jgi:putative transposase